MFIDGIFKNGVSIMPLLEFPRSALACFSRLIYFSD